MLLSTIYHYAILSILSCSDLIRTWHTKYAVTGASYKFVTQQLFLLIFTYYTFLVVFDILILINFHKALPT